MMVRAVDAVITHQALITGRVEDALSSRTTSNPPQLELRYQATAGRAGSVFPLRARVLADGQFVFTGDPQRAFPAVPDGTTLDLRLIARCAGYQEHGIDLSFTADQLNDASEDRVIDGQTVRITRHAAPLGRHFLQLFPLPLHLAGRVVEAENPSEPVGGAEIRVLDAHGVRLGGRLHRERDGASVVRQTQTIGGAIEVTGSLVAGARSLPEGMAESLSAGDVLRVRSTPEHTEYVTVAADGRPAIREPGLLFTHPRKTTSVHRVVMQDATGESEGGRAIAGRVGPGSAVIELSNSAGLDPGEVIRIGTGVNREFQIVSDSAPFGPVTSDGQGFFTLSDVPVRAEITVLVEHADFEPLETTISLDYRTAVNQHTFALTA